MLVVLWMPVCPLELGLIVGFCVGNGLNLGPLEEQQPVILTAEPLSLAPTSYFKLGITLDALLYL